MPNKIKLYTKKGMSSQESGYNSKTWPSHKGGAQLFKFARNPDSAKSEL